jgi:Mn2+/Fe2+ NRAMP family transporter
LDAATAATLGLIGVPVLAGSAAYAFAEAMGWKSGLERKATDARGFYGVIAVSVLAESFIQYSPISPMKALFWSAVINGVVAVTPDGCDHLDRLQEIRYGRIHL